MPTHTIYGDTADRSVYGSNAAFATARENVTGFNNAVNSASETAGMTTGFFIYQYMPGWDTSVVDDTHNIDSATFALYPSSVTGSDTFELRLHDWGSTVETTDWVAGSGLAAKTLLASHSGLTSGAYREFTSDAAFLTSINKTGFTRAVLASIGQRTNVAPSADNRIDFNTGDGASPPRLVVVTSAPAVTFKPQIVVVG